MFRYHEHFPLGQQGKQRLEQLVHERHHRLAMSESLGSLLVVVGSEKRIVQQRSLCHEVDILAEAGVAMLGDPARHQGITRLVDARIGAAEGDEVLVALEASDGSDLGKEVGRGNLADAVDAGDDCQIVGLGPAHKVDQPLGEQFLPGKQRKQVFGAVGDQRTVGSHADRIDGKAPEALGSEGEGASPRTGEEPGKLCVGCLPDGLGAGEMHQQVQHAGGEDIQFQDFGEGDGEVGLQLGLGPRDVLGHLFAPSGNAQPFVVHISPRMRQRLGVLGRELGDDAGIHRIGLGPAEGVGPRELLDQHWVNNKRSLSVVQEPVCQRDVVATGGLHDEARALQAFGLLQQCGKAAVVHGKRPVGSLAAGGEQMEGRALLGNVDADDGVHLGTSLVQGVAVSVPHPISRLTEAPGPNQPMGTLGTGGRLLMKLQSFNNMRPFLPPKDNTTNQWVKNRPIYT